MSPKLNKKDLLPISKAPRDKTLIEVLDLEGNGPFRMYWDKDFVNPLVSSQPGIWVEETGKFTWSEHHNCGPTHFRYLHNA